jgi:hypothetical protein
MFDWMLKEIFNPNFLSVKRLGLEMRTWISSRQSWEPGSVYCNKTSCKALCFVGTEEYSLAKQYVFKLIKPGYMFQLNSHHQAYLHGYIAETWSLVLLTSIRIVVLDCISLYEWLVSTTGWPSLRLCFMFHCLSSVHWCLFSSFLNAPAIYINEH